MAAPGDGSNNLPHDAASNPRYYEGLWDQTQNSGTGGYVSKTGTPAGEAYISSKDGSLVTIGNTTDAAVVSDANGTVSAKLRGLVKILADVWDSTNHLLKVAGQVANGAAVAGNIFVVGGSDGTNARTIKTDSSGVVQVNKAFGDNWQDDGVAAFGTVYFPTATTYTVPSNNVGTTLTIPLGSLLSSDNPWMISPQSIVLGIVNGAYNSTGPTAENITSLTFEFTETINGVVQTMAYPIPLQGSNIAGTTGTPGSGNATTLVIPEIQSGVYPTMQLLVGFSAAPNAGTVTVQMAISSLPTKPTIGYFSTPAAVTITTTTLTNIVAAAATGTRNWVQQVQIANTSASATVVTISDNGTTRAVVPVPANDSRLVTWPGDGLPVSNGHTLDATCSAGVTSVYVVPFVRTRANQNGVA